MPFDSDVWRPPDAITPSSLLHEAIQAPSAFQLRFQNRAVIVGKDGSNAQVAASSAQLAKSKTGAGNKSSNPAGRAGGKMGVVPPAKFSPTKRAVVARQLLGLKPGMQNDYFSPPELQETRSPPRGATLPPPAFPEPVTGGMGEVIRAVGFLTPAQERRVMERRCHKAFEAVSPPRQRQTPPLDGNMGVETGGGGGSRSSSRTPTASAYTLNAMESHISHLKTSLLPTHAGMSPQQLLDSVTPRPTSGGDSLNTSTSSVPVLGKPPALPIGRQHPHSASHAASPLHTPHQAARSRLLAMQGPPRRQPPAGQRLEPLPPNIVAATMPSSSCSPANDYINQNSSSSDYRTQHPVHPASASMIEDASDSDVEVEEVVEVVESKAVKQEGSGGTSSLSTGPSAAAKRPSGGGGAMKGIATTFVTEANVPRRASSSSATAANSSSKISSKEANKSTGGNVKDKDSNAPLQQSPPPHPQRTKAAQVGDQTKVKRTVAPQREEAEEEDSGSQGRQRRNGGYKPYSMEQYKKLMEGVVKQKRGGLGPSDTDAQRAAREKKEREKAYGERVEREAMRAIAEAKIMNAVEEGNAREEAEGGEGEGGRSHSHLTSTPRRRRDENGHLIIEQPTPPEIIEARKRRERAKQYAKGVPRPAPKPNPDHLSGTVAGELDDFLKNPHMKALSPREQAARERTQRLADLEAKHELYQANVARIRKQLRS